MKRTQLTAIGIVAAFVFQTTTIPAAAPSPRRVVSLDGTWQIAEGKMDQVPNAFDRHVPVPGLASLASPPFANPPGPGVVVV